ncbi:MAG TPA: FAD-binding oxidoreductase [Steroidobacteraceae bacterium]|nr:FAD-binding oxidoreductase [Steroidobacteraceae bacterium]
MDRRQFCHSALAGSLTAAVPGLIGWYNSAIAATEADTSIPAVSLDGKEIELERAAIRELGERLTGPVLLAGHPQYDAARVVWNGMHDKRPALIARCLTDQDVRHAVTFAHERRLLTAVRGGGHSWPGKSVCDRGLMIDLSQMNAVTIDPAGRRATVRGGALLSMLDNQALQHGLATTTGVISHTGVGGYTLGGGYGRLNRKYGLTVDNLLGARIVTADGRLRRVSAEEEPDLFWAIRGGGGNFGVVTEFDYRLHPFDRKALCGSLVWPLAQARDVLEFYAEWAPRLSDEMYAGPLLLRHPEAGDVVVMDVLYVGDPAAGEKELAPLRRIGKPTADAVVVQDYMIVQTENDGVFHPGVRSYAKNLLVKEWSQKLVDALVGAYDPRVLLANHVAGGAVKRVGELATAFPHRQAEIMFVVVTTWEDRAKDDEMIAATRAYYDALKPFMGGYYDNIEFDRKEGTETYGPALPRLAKIKRTFDPDNLFRLNSNILPA